MRCSNREELSPREQRYKKQRKETGRKVLKITAGVCVALAITAGVGWYLLTQSPDTSFLIPYDREHLTLGIQADSSKANQYAQPFTSDLCVAAQDVGVTETTITSGAAAMFDLTNQKVLYAKNIHETLYPASLTKIMTALVALKYGNLDDVIHVNANALNVDPESSLCYLQIGDQYTLRQLLYGLMIASGNDAGIAIAEHVSGSVEAFVAKMNEEAGEIGATRTHFTNPHGLQDEEHYTTAYDTYLMFKEAMKYDVFMEIINQKSYVAQFKLEDGQEVERVWSATNFYFTGDVTAPENITVFGGKTGTTNEAGACLSLLSKDMYGNPYFSIVMNAPSKETLYSEMNELLSKTNK